MDITNLDIGETVLAVGAVGTAAMGIVEGYKSIMSRPIGFCKLKKEIDWAKDALTVSYGKNYEEMLSSLFRINRRNGELPRILRQGVRVGLTEDTARKMASIIDVADPDELSNIAKQIMEGADISKKTKERNILGRFEMAADARIDAALGLAERAYKNGIYIRAFVIALTLSFTATICMHGIELSPSQFFLALMVGLTAVPMAPIAKDVAKGIQSVAKAIGTRK